MQIMITAPKMASWSFSNLENVGLSSLSQSCQMAFRPDGENKTLAESENKIYLFLFVP